jgi:hypothetical protein
METIRSREKFARGHPRKRGLLTILAVLAVLGVTLSVTERGGAERIGAGRSGAVGANKKHLIELGWDAPTPNHLRANIKAMEKQPFDGLMVNLNAGKTIFNKTAYPESAFVQDRTDLAATTFRKLEHNFITIWSAREAGWNWFNDNDWAATESNAKNFAKTAKAGRFKGFFFDPEPYGTNPWSYNAQLYPNQDFRVVQAKVRSRGAAFLKAIQAEMPEVKIMTLFGVTHVKTQIYDSGSLERADWTLLVSFIDGMLDVINPKAQLIDGNEISYYNTKPEDFDAFRDEKRASRDLISAENRIKYDQQVGIAHAVFVDGVLNLWKSPRFIGYYLQNDLQRRQLIEHNTYHALRSSDEYVWVYNENMDWWGSKGKGVTLPNGLEESLRRSSQKLKQGKALGLNVQSYMALATKQYQARLRVAGRIILEDGQGLDGVYLDSGQPVNGGDASCQYSNSGGYFACVLPANWSGTITPSGQGLKFEPPALTVKNLIKNTDDQNFKVVR